jgi:hypothetical protein
MDPGGVAMMIRLNVSILGTLAALSRQMIAERLEST